jgi:hypothetical protein
MPASRRWSGLAGSTGQLFNQMLYQQASALAEWCLEPWSGEAELLHEFWTFWTIWTETYLALA